MAVKQRLTAEELWALPEVPGKRYELVRGELVEVPGAGGVHAQLIVNLLLLLHPFVTGRGLGRVFGDGLAYVIARDPDVVRIPDVSFIAQARLPDGSVPEGFIPGAPDLAVEIVSPGDRAEEVYGKGREYLDAGARLVWVVWPRHRAVTAYTPDGQSRELREDDELDGGAVLPGFRVRVGDLFADVR
jgi:Uma2 family endonuclease